MAEISPELQLRAVSSPVPESTLRARHRRFFKSRQNREARRIQERDDYNRKINKNGTFDTSSEDDGATKTRIPRPPPVRATPTFAEITSSPASLAPSKPPQSFITSTSSIPTTLATSPPVANETPTALPANQNPPLVTPIVPPTQVPQNPVAVPQPTTFSTSSATPTPSFLPANIGGFGGINGFTRHGATASTASSGIITGVVLGVFGLIVAAGLTFFLIKRHRVRRLSYPRGAVPPMSQASSGKPPSVIARAKQRAESILWGSQATVGTRTEASFTPSSVPTSMKSGGKLNKDGLNMLVPPPIHPIAARNLNPNPHRHSGSTDWDKFARPTSVRSPGPNMQSISGMTPPFRNVDSWVAKGNGGGELEPRGPYSRLN